MFMRKILGNIFYFKCSNEKRLSVKQDGSLRVDIPKEADTSPAER
jgi:hypothetical protein